MKGKNVLRVKKSYTAGNKTNLGVKLSGGADSSIIYYALCDKFKDNDNVNIIPITVGTDEKWWYPKGAEKVIDIVGQITGKYPIEHMVLENIPHTMENYTGSQNDIAKKAMKKYKIHPYNFYSGLTYNPPMKKMVTYFERRHKHHGLDLNEVMLNINSRDKSRDNKFQGHLDATMRPLKDKLDTARWYKHYNAMDTLYPHTFSCESPQTEKLEHCHHCFFCLERYFAFGRII